MFERLFDNIGGKIKVLAKVVFILEAIAAVIAGIAILVIDDGEGPLMPLGFITMIGGPVIAWVSSWLLYGFGELIDNAGEIAQNTRVIGRILEKTKVENQKKPETQPKNENRGKSEKQTNTEKRPTSTIEKTLPQKPISEKKSQPENSPTRETKATTAPADDEVNPAEIAILLDGKKQLEEQIEELKKKKDDANRELDAVQKRITALSIEKNDLGTSKKNESKKRTLQEQIYATQKESVEIRRKLAAFEYKIKPLQIRLDEICNRIEEIDEE